MSAYFAASNASDRGTTDCWAVDRAALTTYGIHRGCLSGEGRDGHCDGLRSAAGGVRYCVRVAARLKSMFDEERSTGSTAPTTGGSESRANDKGTGWRRELLVNRQCPEAADVRAPRIGIGGRRQPTSTLERHRARDSWRANGGDNGGELNTRTVDQSRRPGKFAYTVLSCSSIL